MPVTQDNGAITPINSDAYNLAPDVATLANSLSVITNVVSQAARDALTKFTGRTVRRIDLGGALEWWDGAAWVGINHAEYTSAVTPPANTSWGPGVMAQDAASTFDPAFTTATSDTFTVTKRGIYAVSVVVVITGSGISIAGTALDITDNSGAILIRQPSPDGKDRIATSIPNLNLAAGASFKVKYFHTGTGTQTWTSRVRITKVA